MKNEFFTHTLGIHPEACTSSIFPGTSATEGSMSAGKNRTRAGLVMNSQGVCGNELSQHTSDLVFSPGWLLPQNSTRFSTAAHRDRSEATVVITTPYVY